MKSKRCAIGDCSGWHPFSGLIPSAGSVDGEGSQTLPLETALSGDELTWPRSYKSVRVNRKERGHSHGLVHVGDEGPLTPVPHGGPLEGHPNSSVPYGIIFCCTWTAVQFLPLPKSIPPQILFQRILVNILPACMSPSQSLLHREPTKTKKKKIPLDMLREEWLIESNDGYNGLNWTKFIKHLWCSRHCAEHWRYTVKLSWIKQNGSQGTHWPETQTLQQVTIIQRRQALH